MRPPLSERELQFLFRKRRVSDATRAKVMRRDKACRYCGSTSGPFEIDHRVPVSLGGSNRLSNLVLSCADCNRRKGASIW